MKRFVVDGKKITEAQLVLAKHLKQLGYAGPTFEHRFHENRQWRFDLAFPCIRLAFECDGGKWAGGHNRGDRIDDNNEKKNHAQMLGWRVLTFTNEAVLSGKAKAFLKNWL